MKQIAVAFVFTALLCNGTLTQSLAHAATPKSTEVLVVAPYPGGAPWKEITHQANANGEIVEWIPSDQGIADIKDILTRQVFLGLKKQDPATFLREVLQRMGGACERARTNGPKEATEHGYAVAYAQAYCSNQKGAAKDADIFLKAIRGNDALYVVQREFRRPAQPGATPGIATFSKDQMGEASARLNAQSVANRFLVESVQLCPGTPGTDHCADGH